MAINKPDIHKTIIIGGGWAGIEAAAALGRKNKECLLITENIDAIGWIERPELGRDAGLFKLLQKEGSLLPQIVDKKASSEKRWQYAMYTKNHIDKIPSLHLMQDSIISVSKKNNAYILTSGSGRLYKSTRLILCTGTGLRQRKDNVVAGLGIKTEGARIIYPPLEINGKGKLRLRSKGEVAVPGRASPYKIIARTGPRSWGGKLYAAGKCTGAKTLEESAFQGMMAGMAASNKKLISQSPILQCST